MQQLDLNITDGGRSKYFRGQCGDCVTRALAIALNMDYKVVYDRIKDIIGGSPRNGLTTKETRRVMASLGFFWKPIMKIGTGVTCHLRKGEVPMNEPIICSCSGHVVAVVNGVVNDCFDCRRGGNRAVYGYWYIPKRG